MRRTLARLLETALAVWCAICLGACIDRQRINPSCEWSDIQTGPLDLRRAADRRHLRDDALIAEELGIRLGDSFLGVKSIAERREIRTACTDSLFGVIARTHGVSIEDVRMAPMRRNLFVDLLLVLLPMLGVLSWAAAGAADRVRRRFLPDEPALALIFTLLVALAVSGIWWAVGEQWSWIVEMLRLRDGHISYRADRLPWYRFGMPLFVLGVVLCCLIAWRRWYREASGAA